MEVFNIELNSRGTTLDTDASSATRLSQRPPSSQSRGAAFEDLGSTFGKNKNPPRAASTSRAPSYKRGGTSNRAGTIELSDDSSEDEINFLSEHSRHDSTSPKRNKKSTKSTKAKGQPPTSVTVVIDHHQGDPNYKPIDLKKMKITKKSVAASSASQTPEHSQGSRPMETGLSSDAVLPLPRTSGRTNVSSDAEKANQRKKLPLREHRPNQDRSRARRPSTPPLDKGNNAVKRIQEDKDADKTPRPSRPVPRPVNKGLGKSQTVPELSSQSNATDQDKSQSLPRSQSMQRFPSPVQSPLRVSDDGSDGLKTDVPTRKARGKMQGKVTGRGRGKAEVDAQPGSFPPLSPLPSPVNASKGKGKGKARVNPISALSPLSSPVRPTRRNQAASFPALSPLSSPPSRHSSPPSRAGVRRLNHRRTVISSSDDESADGVAQLTLHPFPMGTQELASIRRSSPVSKRLTPDGGVENNDGAYKKKRRRESDQFVLDADSDSDDDMFLDPSVDPKTLCPWCDEPLPLDPTPHLRALLDAARRVSRPDDRVTNPLGLHAPLSTFISVCQRHRFERNWIPRACRKGWPTKIEWGKLVGRITRLKDDLRAIVDDIDENFASEVSRRKIRPDHTRARKENEFWKEVVQNVRQQGSRQTAGVRGQFLHFNKTQPGYYGELGYVIIHQTLCDLFPPAEFHPDAALPLTPADFISLVLVPEAAVRLIIQDLALPRDQAIETLRESVEYGVAMFPADEDEGEVASGSGRSRRSKDDGVTALGAGERMLMERARAKRKELEEEERKEEEAATKPRPRARSKAPETAAQTDVESTEPKSSPPSGESGLDAKRKARTTSRVRSTSRARSASVSRDAIMVSSDTGESDATGPLKRRRKGKRPAAEDESDIEMLSGGEQTGGYDATPKAKSKLRPRPKTRSASTAPANNDDDRHWDIPEPSLPSSSSQPTPFISFSRKGDVTIHRPTAPDLVNATPRAKSKVQKFDTLSAIPDAASAGLRLPLQIARERRQREQARQPSHSIVSKADEWHHSLRVGNTESTDDEMSDAQCAPSSSSRPLGGAMTPRYGDRKEKGSWDWLLSDGSQAGFDSPEPQSAVMDCS